jgi:hypothetical protein
MLENKQKLEEENKQDKILILSLVFILIFFVTTIFLIFSYTKICSASSASDLATAIGNMQQADETTYI